MFRIYCLLIGYLLGCFQTAYFVGKIFKKTDIREHGSGNAGATNAIRTFGMKTGLIVFIIDILKTITACVLCSVIFHGSTTFALGDSNYLPMLYAGLGTVLGHNFPVFLKFKGGKGVACTVAIVLMLNPYVAVITYVLGVIAIAVSRYVSFGSLVIFLAFPVSMIFFGFAVEEIVLAFIMCALGWFQHRGNIKSILRGNERKFNFGKKG